MRTVIKYSFLIGMATLLSCSKETEVALEPKADFYLSIENSQQIAELRGRVANDLRSSRLDFDLDEFLEAADWTKVRYVDTPNIGMEIYSMPIDYVTEAY